MSRAFGHVKSPRSRASRRAGRRHLLAGSRVVGSRIAASRDLRHRAGPRRLPAFVKRTRFRHHARSGGVNARPTKKSARRLSRRSNRASSLRPSAQRPVVSTALTPRSFLSGSAQGRRQRCCRPKGRPRPTRRARPNAPADRDRRDGEPKAPAAAELELEQSQSAIAAPIMALSRRSARLGDEAGEAAGADGDASRAWAQHRVAAGTQHESGARRAQHSTPAGPRPRRARADADQGGNARPPPSTRARNGES